MEYNFETLNCCYDREVYKHVIKTQSIELAEFVIKKWNLNYRFYLRVHAFNTYELVLYCYNKYLSKY